MPPNGTGMVRVPYFTIHVQAAAWGIAASFFPRGSGVPLPGAESTPVHLPPPRGTLALYCTKFTNHNERVMCLYLVKSVSQSLHASKPGMIGPEGKSLGVAVPCRLVPRENAWYGTSTIKVYHCSSGRRRSEYSTNGVRNVLKREENGEDTAVFRGSRSFAAAEKVTSKTTTQAARQ